MLMVAAKVGPSEIHGLGLIAQEWIAAGTIVWELRPGFDLEFSDEDLQQLSPASRSQVLHYCDGDFCPERKVWTLSGDDARFTNHSDDANTVNTDDGQQTVAIRDIAPGEEITWNYRSFHTNITAHDVLKDRRPVPVTKFCKELPNHATMTKVHSFLSDKCYCRNSNIDRLGIFAKTKIDEGEVLAIWGGVVYSGKEYQSLQFTVAEADSRVVEICDGCWLGSFDFDRRDDSELFNHSCNPNVGVQGQIVLVARRQIDPEEELTIDYETLEMRPQSFRCDCGSLNCRSELTGESWKDLDFRTRNQGYLAWQIERAIARE